MVLSAAMTNEDRPFLDVRNSILGQVWRERLDARGRNVAATIAQSTEIPELVARTGRQRDDHQWANNGR